VSLILFGACAHPIPLDPRLTCVAHCTLVVDPLAILIFHGTELTVPIPNEPALVGLAVCTQCVCASSTHLCLTLSMGLRVTITH